MLFLLTRFPKLVKECPKSEELKNTEGMYSSSFNFSTGLVSLQCKRSSQCWEHAVQIHHCKFLPQSLAYEPRNNSTAFYLALVRHHTERDILPGPLKKSCQKERPNTALHLHCDGLWLHQKIFFLFNEKFLFFYVIYCVFYLIHYYYFLSNVG